MCIVYKMNVVVTWSPFEAARIGAGRALMSSLKDSELQIVVVVVSSWYGSKIGARRFSHIKDVGLSAAKNVCAVPTSS